MKISAIISEYNPLHNGHVYHIKKTREITDSDAIVCIMSGNYVQRGIPALIDKWNRTKSALECGADLIIELPVVYSLSSAEFFAYGSVSLLNSLGTVNSLSFGSELGNISLLSDIAGILNEEPENFRKYLRSYLDSGLAFPVARSRALEKYITHTNEFYSSSNFVDTMSTSNNILAIEYCRSLQKLNSNIKPYTIKREGGAYNSSELNNTFSSATSIRKFLKESSEVAELKNHLPPSTFFMLETLKKSGYVFVFEDQIYKFIKYKSYAANQAIDNLPDATEGLHNKIYKSLINSHNYIELIEKIKSRRYTHTRISRILCQYYIGFENYDTKLLRSEPCPYARVLGFNETGAKILKDFKNNSSIPIYVKLPDSLSPTLSLDVQATRTYSMLNKFISPSSDYLISPIRI